MRCRVLAAVVEVVVVVRFGVPLRSWPGETLLPTPALVLGRVKCVPLLVPGRVVVVVARLRIEPGVGEAGM